MHPVHTQARSCACVVNSNRKDLAISTAIDIRKTTQTETTTEIRRKDRLELAERLADALSSTYVLYAKTQGLHWNVTGPLFVSVHELTETHYKDLAEAIDDIAERIRALGAPAPVGLTGYVQSSAVVDQNDLGDIKPMLKQLAADHELVANEMRSMVNMADERDDVYTADLLTARIGAHEEAAWMLNALSA